EGQVDRKGQPAPFQRSRPPQPASTPYGATSCVAPPLVSHCRRRASCIICLMTAMASAPVRRLIAHYLISNPLNPAKSSTADKVCDSLEPSAPGPQATALYRDVHRALPAARANYSAEGM